MTVKHSKGNVLGESLVGNEHAKKVTPFMGDTYFELRERGIRC